MGIRLPARKRVTGRRSWHGAAFILEALILLVFLLVFAVILLGLFSDTHARSTEAEQLSGAIVLATNDAEAFAADPQSDTQTFYYVVSDGAISLSSESDPAALAVTRTVSNESRDGGTMYFADIAVTQQGELIYELSTARYLSYSEEVDAS
ncbi:MAG: hypothetical protein RR505_00220 [Raoultibacter sp.]